MYKLLLPLVFLLMILMIFCYAITRVDNTANDTSESAFNLKLMKTYQVDGRFDASLRSLYDTFRVWNDDYVPAIQSLYIMNRSDLLKLTLATGEVETFPFDFDMFEKRKYPWQKFLISAEKDMIMVQQGRYDEYLSVSPNGKYALFRYFPHKNELYEIQSGKLLSCGIDDEIILGFDNNSNIYCGRQSLANLFVLRNPCDMSLLWEYKAGDYSPDSDNPIPMDLSPNQGGNSGSYYGIQFSNYRSPISTPDGRYSIIMFTVHQFRGHLAMVLIFDNREKTMIHSSCMSLPRYSTSLYHLFRHDGKMLAIPGGRKGVWVYDFEKNFSRTCAIPETNLQNLAGFYFTPDNHIVLWIQHYADIMFGGPGQTAYRFNLENGAMEEFTDFSVEDRYTRLYFFSPDGKTAITFETIPGRYMDDQHYGHYVFWDVDSKQRLLETEETYLPNIIITPDWKTIYLTKTMNRPPAPSISPPELPELKPLDVEVYDISSIINRP